MELGEVMFDDASAKLREQYLPVIDKMAEQVKQHSGGEVVIAANGESQALAYDRAKAVQSALLAQLSPEQAKSLQVSLRTDVADVGSTLLKLDGQSRLLGDVLFDTDKSEIKPEFAPVIEKIAADIDKLGTGRASEIGVGVIGHADKRGAPAYNDALALRRAKAVYEAIAAKLSPEVRSKLRVEISDNPTAPVGSSK
jgi:outer membrane protein OmpA-like peptidoglycan-associated protein